MASGDFKVVFSREQLANIIYGHMVAIDAIKPGAGGQAVITFLCDEKTGLRRVEVSVEAARNAAGKGE